MKFREAMNAAKEKSADIAYTHCVVHVNAEIITVIDEDTVQVSYRLSDWTGPETVATWKNGECMDKVETSRIFIGEF